MTEPAYNPISNQMSDEELVSEIVSLQSSADEADLKVKRAKNDLLERKAKEISLALKQKDEPFGAVSQVIGTNNYATGMNTGLANGSFEHFGIS